MSWQTQQTKKELMQLKNAKTNKKPNTSSKFEDGKKVRGGHMSYAKMVQDDNDNFGTV
jgi:hypothetical protein